MIIVDSVATKAGTRARRISRPFKRPHAAPMAQEMSTISVAPNPASRSSRAAVIATSVTIAPIDRSMAPIMITKVVPVATMSRMDDWRIRLKTFAQERNRGLSVVKTMTRRSRNARGTSTPIKLRLRSYNATRIAIANFPSQTMKPTSSCSVGLASTGAGRSLTMAPSRIIRMRLERPISSSRSSVISRIATPFAVRSRMSA